MEYFDFLKGLWSNPRAVSSPTPSSAVLADAIAAQVDPRTPGMLIELGAGTGAITRALLARGFSPERIIAIEYEPVLADAIRKRFPEVHVICGDAFQLDSLLPRQLIISAVVSGLPMLNFSQQRRQSLLSYALARQAADKRFIQLSYSWVPPIQPASPDVTVSSRLIWRNLPPAHVWRYQAVAVPAAALV